jgi:esterase/lipase superfamily enzyme
LQLGGADTPENIWPLCGPAGAAPTQRYSRVKSIVDDYLVAKVRAGNISLSDAQSQIAADWTQYLAVALAAAGINQRYRNHSRAVGRIENDPRVLRLLIASTRAIERIPAPTNGLELVSSDQRNSELSFGAALVRVPDDHIAGQVERPFCLCLFGITLYRESENKQKYFTLKSTTWLSQDDFINEINNNNEHEALVFVHGFNTSLEDGLFRLGQIVFDSHFSGIPILYSWPSKGGVASYLYDAESAQFSLTGFRELIKLLQDDTNISTIHIIAHSMGNRIVLAALESGVIQQKSLGQLVLAAPDVDREVFKIEEQNIKGFRGITLYASAKDWALKLSEELARDFARAGDVPAPPDSPIVLANMDTIDASLLGDDLLGLNHDTFAASAALCDIGRLLSTGKPPDVRTPPIQPVAGPPRYWRYGGIDLTWDPQHGCQ